MSSESAFDSILEILKILRTIANTNDMQLLGNAEFKWDIDLPHNQRIKKVYEFVFYNFQKML